MGPHPGVAHGRLASIAHLPGRGGRGKGLGHRPVPQPRGRQPCWPGCSQPSGPAGCPGQGPPHAGVGAH
eukprot:4762841-Alexandrium_andersonii.AAC.1